jgi:hypothetical protein
MEISQIKRMGNVTEVAQAKSTERAVCELCGHVIATTNGGRHTGLVFLPFERLLEMHMEQRHPNLCVLPGTDEYKKAA